MRVLRGRLSTPTADRCRSRELVSTVRSTAEPALRVWQPPRHVAFGRRDANSQGYSQAKRLLATRNIRFIERSVGGHAVFFTGRTIAFLHAEPIADPRLGVTERYDSVLADVRDALSELGVETTRGEPAAAFCPGTHSLSHEGKIVGVAQRVRQDVAVVAGIVVVTDHEAIASLLDELYPLLGLSFDPAATGSIQRAGGKTRPGTVRRELEDALADESKTLEFLRDT